MTTPRRKKVRVYSPLQKLAQRRFTAIGQVAGATTLLRMVAEDFKLPMTGRIEDLRIEMLRLIDQHAQLHGLNIKEAR